MQTDAVDLDLPEGATKTDRLRAAARKLERFRLSELYEAAGFGRPDEKERKRLWYLVRDMKKRREVRPADHGVYFYAKDAPADGSWERAKACPDQKKMWRVMRGLDKRQPFSVADVEQLAEVSRDYAGQYVTFLRREGHIAVVGREPGLGGTTRRALYRIVRDRDVPEAPRWNRSKVERDKKAREIAQAGAAEGLTVIERVHLIQGLFAEGVEQVEALARELEGRG